MSTKEDRIGFGGIILLSLLYGLPIVGLGLGLYSILHPRPHVQFKATTLQDGVLYATTRKWPMLESLPPEPRLRWLRHEGSTVLLDDRPPAASLAGQEIVVLVHGFHGTEEVVATYFFELVQHLRSDLRFAGGIVVYDWPSIALRYGWEVVKMQREWEGYFCDPRCPGKLSPIPPEAQWEGEQYHIDRGLAKAEGTPGLPILLKTLRETYRPSSISVIAHSMGTWVTMEAIRRYPDIGPLRRVVLLAADVDATLLDAADVRAGMTTVDAVHVYHSRRDEVLDYSRILNGQKRLGKEGPAAMANLPGNVFIHDVTAALSGEGVHSGYLTRQGATEIALGEALR